MEILIEYLQRAVLNYYGEKAWEGARDLHGVLNIPEEIRPFVGNYPMHLVEVVDNNLQFENADNRDLFQLFNLVYNSSLDKKERMQKAQEYENSHSIDVDVIRVLAAANNVKLEKTDKKERLKVCTLFEEIAKDSRIEGRTEANIETAQEMIRNNEPIEKIMKYSRLPKETILELQKQEDLQPV